MKTKDFKKTKGITLISLVVSIVVLLILAGVSIVTLTGDNGLLMQVQNTKEKTEVARFKEEVQLAYMTAYSENVEKGTYTVSMEDLLGKLYIDHPEYDNSEKILDGAQGNISSIKAMWEGTEVNETNGVLIAKSGTEKIDIVPVGSTGEEVTKFVVLDGKYYEIILNENGVKLGEAQDSIQQSTITLNAQKITGLDSVTVTNENKKVTLQAVNSTDTGTIKITYGLYEVTVKVDVKELYKVSFYKESGDSEVYATKNVEPGQTIGSGKMPLNPTKENYEFTSWKVGNTIFNENTIISANTSVYAVWEIAGFEVTHPANERFLNYFGKLVEGYSPNNGSNWRLFYADSEHAYLLSDSIGGMIYPNLPGFGNSTISLLAQNFNPKFTSWTMQTNGELNTNIKGVAALMDTENWKDYKTSDADYAVGAPTLEMFIASYNATHSSATIPRLYCKIVNKGYSISIDNNTWPDSSYMVSGLEYSTDLDRSIYGGSCYWLASPSKVNGNYLCAVEGNGRVGCGDKSGWAAYVRPMAVLPISRVGLDGENKVITITDNYFDN